MHKLRISELTIGGTSIIIDQKNRFLNYGTYYPHWLGRIRFYSRPELHLKEKGSILRLSTVIRGKERTAEQMNRTLVHELEHLAQYERHDIKVTLGHLIILMLTLMGATAFSQFGGGKGGVIIGAILGYELGYWIAPHERQARLRAGQISNRAPQVASKAISRNNAN